MPARRRSHPHEVFVLTSPEVGNRVKIFYHHEVKTLVTALLNRQGISLPYYTHDELATGKLTYFGPRGSRDLTPLLKIAVVNYIASARGAGLEFYGMMPSPSQGPAYQQHRRRYVRELRSEIERLTRD